MKTYENQAQNQVPLKDTRDLERRVWRCNKYNNHQQSSTIWSLKSGPQLSNAVLSIRFELALVFGAVCKGQFALAAHVA